MDTNYLISILFLLLGVSVIIRNYEFKKYSSFFWFCDFAPFLFAIGFFLNNIQFLKAIISVGMIGQIIAIFNVLPFRIAKWNKDKTSYRTFYIFSDILLHLTTIIVLILTFSFPPEIESIKYSFFILVVMFFVTIIFTPKAENVNTIYYSEINSKDKKTRFKLPFHTILWVFYGLIVVSITYLIQYLLYLYL